MSAIITLPIEAASPEAVSVDRTASSLPRKPVRQAETELCSARPPWATSSKWVKTRRSFRRCIAPSTTRARVPCMATQTDRHCLAADTAGPQARFLLRAHSQTHPFEAPGRQARHRLPHRQDEPFPGYSRPSHNRSRRLTCAVCPKLPLGHSFRTRVCESDFAGQNTEAPQLPIGRGLSNAVRHRLRLRLLARA